MKPFTVFARAGCVAALLLLPACARTVLPPPATPRPAAEASSTPERRAVLREAAGAVQARGDAAGAWAPALAGLDLSVGSQIRTGADGRALVELTEGARIRLGPGTSLTVNLLNPYLDSRLMAVALDRGSVWLLLPAETALDVETPVGLATARGAYMSVAYDEARQTIELTCLLGTCAFDQSQVPAGHRYGQAGLATGQSAPLSLADYGQWGLAVPEAAGLAAWAAPATAQAPPAPVTAVPSSTPAPPTETLAPSAPTLAAPTAAPAVPAPAISRPSATPWPAAQVLGRHRVLAGETIFCLGRAYGVQPEAIIQANALPAPYLLAADQVLVIPAEPWTPILPGPVCAPQFASPYPGLPFLTAPPPASPTPSLSPTPAAALVVHEVAALCTGNCTDPAAPTYRLLILVTASGGSAPLTYEPGQRYELDFARCVKASGVVTVRSADGQSASGSWVYDDTACPATAGP